VIVPGGGLQEKDLATIPPCRSDTQLHRVAYSSFPSVPPAGSLFGRPNGPTSSGVSAGPVICTNPAALSEGAANLDTSFPTDQNLLSGGTNQPTVTTPWVEYPNLLPHPAGKGGVLRGSRSLTVERQATHDRTRARPSALYGATTSTTSTSLSGTWCTRSVSSRASTCTSRFGAHASERLSFEDGTNVRQCFSELWVPLPILHVPPRGRTGASAPRDGHPVLRLET
jgi:hypothetical protein